MLVLIMICRKTTTNCVLQAVGGVLQQVLIPSFGSEELRASAVRALSECCAGAVADEHMAGVASLLFPALGWLPQAFAESVTASEDHTNLCQTLVLLAIGVAESLLPVIVNCEALGLFEPAMLILKTILLATEHVDQFITLDTIGFWDVLIKTADTRVQWVQQLYSGIVQAVTRRCQ